MTTKNTIDTFNKPVRIRSKILVLLYRNCKTDINTLKNSLAKAFGIDSEKNWKYIFKTELLRDTSDIVAFLELQNTPDVYTRKLELIINTPKPSIWCFQERSFALYSLLKFYNSDDCETNLTTNMDTQDLQAFVTILKAVDTTVEKEAKKTLKERQLKKIGAYMQKIDSLIEKDSTNFKSIRRAMSNIINYRSKYEIPIELNKKIKAYQKMTTLHMSPKNPKNKNLADF